MSEFITAFSPGMEHVFRQRDLEKSLIVETGKGAPGPQPPDLESGVIELDVPTRPTNDDDEA